MRAPAMMGVGVSGMVGLRLSFLTSPRLRGEVGTQRKAASRVRGTIRESEYMERAPHPNPLPAKGRGEGEGQRGLPHASSDISPSGRPNSNVFSVIETMV